MKDLAERKRIPILQADVHRSVIELERLRLQQGFDMVCAQMRSKSWLLLGGAVVTGWLSTRLLGPLLKYVPAGLAAWRVLRNLMPR
jgi:hypothetical protein